MAVSLISHGLLVVALVIMFMIRGAQPVALIIAAHSVFLYNGYRVFLGGKERPGRDADPSPSSSAVVMKE
jgi:hypothetical protein